jgi:hypothetical protein
MGSKVGIGACPWCAEDGTPLACQLDTVPKSFAVVCSNCGAQGPTATSFEDANDEWSDTAGITVGTVDTTEELDAALMGLEAHATALRDLVAAGDVDVERAVVLGALGAIVLVLNGVTPNDFGEVALRGGNDS